MNCRGTGGTQIGLVRSERHAQAVAGRGRSAGGAVRDRRRRGGRGLGRLWRRYNRRERDSGRRPSGQGCCRRGRRRSYRVRRRCRWRGCSRGRGLGRTCGGRGPCRQWFALPGDDNTLGCPLRRWPMLQWPLCRGFAARQGIERMQIDGHLRLHGRGRAEQTGEQDADSSHACQNTEESRAMTETQSVIVRPHADFVRRPAPRRCSVRGADGDWRRSRRRYRGDPCPQDR